MQNLWSANILHVIQDMYQVINIMAVYRAKVAQIKCLEKVTLIKNQ